MNEEERKAWKMMCGIAKRNLSMKITDPNFRMAQRIFLAADAELTRLRAALSRFTAPIVCICGSTRFKQAWIAENARLTGEGNIVLAVGLWGHHERVFPDEATKKKLDELHLRKIDLCDWVWVLDIGGYIGESTRNEIAYAEAHGKPVRYLSKEIPDYAEPVDRHASIAERVDQLCPGRECGEDTDYGRGWDAGVRAAQKFLREG